MRLQVTGASVAFKPCRLVLAESIQPVLPGVQGTIAGVIGGTWIKGDGVFAVPEHVDCKAVPLGGGTLKTLKKVLRSTLNVTSEEHKLLKAGKLPCGKLVSIATPDTVLANAVRVVSMDIVKGVRQACTANGCTVSKSSWALTQESATVYLFTSVSVEGELGLLLSIGAKDAGTVVVPPSVRGTSFYKDAAMVLPREAVLAFVLLSAAVVTIYYLTNTRLLVNTHAPCRHKLEKWK